jgi:hypothetical protein
MPRYERSDGSSNALRRDVAPEVEVLELRLAVVPELDVCGDETSA